MNSFKQGVGVAFLSLVILVFGSYSFFHLPENKIAVVQGQQVSQAAAPTSGLVAHWNFDEGSGTIATDSVGGINGTLENGPMWSNDKVVGTGSIVFDGANDGVSLGNTSALQGLSSFSVGGWIKMGDINGIRSFISKFNGGFNNGPFNLWYLKVSEAIVFTVCTNTVTNCVNALHSFPPAHAGDGKWHHILGVYDGSSVKVYLDGVAGNPVSLSGNTIVDTTATWIGRSAAGDDFFKGQFDDFRFYNKALTAAEVGTLVTAAGGTIGTTPPSTGGGTQPPSDPGTPPSQPPPPTSGQPPSSNVTPVPYKNVSWTPPIGIPEPPFGIREDVSHFILRSGETCSSHPQKCYDYGSGPVAYSLNPQGEPYTHYVDNSVSGCVYEGYGKPAQPLCRIPLSLSAGSIVEVHGQYKAHHSSPANLVINGTSQRPVFIRSTASDKARVKGGTWEMNGTYAILENLIVEDDDGNLNGGAFTGLGITAPSSYFSIRHNEVSGNLLGGGIGVLNYAPDTLKVQYVTIYNNTVHDAGNYLAPEDGAPGSDVGGIGLANSHYVWAVDNTCYRNGVECVWGGAGYVDNAALGHARSHHVYIGRNNVWESRQGGVWQKGGRYIVISQNKIRKTLDLRHQDGRGHGIGFQYGSEDVWFLFNEISDVSVGIVAAGGASLNNGKNVYAIGNVISDTKSGYANSGHGINLYGSENRYIVGNTLSSVQSGITLLNGKNTVVNNIISNVTGLGTIPSSRHFVFNNETNLGSLVANNNLFYQPGGSALINANLSVTGLNATNYAENNIEANPLFVSSANLGLQSSSPAIDKGESAVINQLATIYASTFGVDIKKDLLGVTRPQGTAWDIGAHEFTGQPTTPTQPAPQTPKVGDFNNDGVVNSLDMSLMAGEWNKNHATYDLNKDGIVNTLDFTIMVKNWTS